MSRYIPKTMYLDILKQLIVWNGENNWVGVLAIVGFFFVTE